MVEQKATNITWQQGSLRKETREKLKGHRGAVLWLTGLPGSGKSTLAIALERILHDRRCHTYVLDGDNVRHGLNKDLGFSPPDRHENIRRIGEVAHLFSDAGLISITAFISPYVTDRLLARGMNSKGTFVEIYCKCPLRVCEQRDTKGLYKKARDGQIKDFTGIDAPYECPLEPEVTVCTDQETVAESAGKVIAYLEQRAIIPEVETVEKLG